MVYRETHWFVLPDDLAATRSASHTVAEWVLASARSAHTGRIGLRAAPGGFATPPFANDRVVRVDGNELVVVEGDDEARARLTTLADAAAFAGVPPATKTGAYEPVTTWTPDDPLAIDDDAARLLARWFASAASWLGCRARIPPPRQGAAQPLTTPVPTRTNRADIAIC
jgi:hypothetical protein